MATARKHGENHDTHDEEKGRVGEANSRKESASADPAGVAAGNSRKESGSPDSDRRPRGRPRKKSRQGKGGGAKTPEGKKRSSQNAIKYGIHALHPVIIPDFESEEEWDDFYDGFIEYYQPDGPPEQDLVYQMAANRWRARRIIQAEAAEIGIQVWSTEDDLGFDDAFENALKKGHVKGQRFDPDPERVLIRQQERIIPYPRKAQLIVRYEAHLHRAWRQFCLQLDMMQARRLNRPTASVYFHHSSGPAQLDDTSQPQLSDGHPDAP